MSRETTICDGCLFGLLGGSGVGALGFAIAIAFAPITDIVRPSVEWGVLFGY